MPLYAGQRAGKGVLAYRIIGHIHPGITGDLHHPRNHILGFIVDHMVIAMCRRQRAFIRPAGGADGCCAKRFQPLPGQKPHPACRRMEQHRITGLYRMAVLHQIGNGQPLQHDGRRQIRRDGIRQLDHHVGIDGAMRGIGPVWQGIANTVTNRDMADALADGGDDAGTLAAEDQVLVHRPGIGAGANIDVDEINADGLMCDYHLARTGCRYVDLDTANHVRPARARRCHCICHHHCSFCSTNTACMVCLWETYGRHAIDFL